MYAYNETQSALDKQKLVDALKPWDEGWEQWSPELQGAMAPAGQRLDEFLLASGIEPVRPPSGVAFDPHRHGSAVHAEASELPQDTIARLLYRGYRDITTGAWLREPVVVVSSASWVRSVVPLSTTDTLARLRSPPSRSPLPFTS